MKQITTGEYLIQEVPEGAMGCYIDGKVLWFKFAENVFAGEDLPKGQWQIVEPTEEQKEEARSEGIEFDNHKLLKKIK